MQSNSEIKRAKKRDIMIAILLLACIMLAISVCVLISRVVGAPVFLDGRIENIRVRFTEVCSRNSSIISYNGKYCDYIELYNDGKTFNLQGFALTDGLYKEAKYVFESRVFNSGEYMVVFLDGKNVPFALKGDGGETVYLLSPGGKECASVETVKTESDEVLLYKDDSYIVSDEASPGYPNTEEGLEQYRLGLSDNTNTLVISELLTANKSVLPDKNGVFSDIIEIKNISSEDISTSGWHVSDSTKNPHRYALPSLTIKPGEHLIIFADGTDLYKDNEIHASFGLSEGETVVLTAPGGKYSAVEVTETEDNISKCLIVAENGDLIYELSSPSPGFDNTEEGIFAFNQSRIDNDSELVISEILLSFDEYAYNGKVCDVIEIMNVSSGEVNTKGWFVSDNTENPYKFELPERIIAPGECIVVIADGENNTEQDIIHANFSLSNDETLFIFTPEKKYGSKFKVIPAGRGKSWNIDKSDDEIGYLTDEPSIGFTNDENGIDEFQSTVRPTGIEISEAVSKNTKYLPGPYGTYHDFIELHNNSNKDISLAGMYLSDDIRNLGLASLQNITLKAGDYIVFMLSGDGVNIPSGYISLPFALAREGETVYLSKDGKIIDCMVIPSLLPDNSFGRPQGRDGFDFLTTVTPGAANSKAADQPAPKPAASVEQGVYNGVGSIEIELEGKGEIRYTLDSTEPTPESQIYNKPLVIMKTTVVRARCFISGYAPGRILDLIYVMNEGHNLEVVSIITNPPNLWDFYTGIYVEGPGASATYPHVGANYWQQWEKEATVSFFANDGTSFTEPCGLRIFGAYSRALDMKSFSCFFRAKYGSSQLNYQLFRDSELDVYEAFILRNSGQDFNRARMRDVLVSSLVSENTSVDVQKYRPAVVYLNGEFWGVYYIREKINENYIAGNYCVNKDSVELARANGVTSDEYMKLISYVKSHDLSKKENYEYIISQIDEDNYINYICAQIYIANSDNGNIRFFKTDEADGKWRWIMFDVDWSFDNYTHPTVFEHLNPAGTGSLNRFSTALINGLLKNTSFKEKFLKRMAWQINNIWTEESVYGRIDELKQMLSADMVRDCKKWNLSHSNWEKHIERLRNFQKNRPAEMYRQIKNHFKLSDSQMTELGYKA